MGSILDGLRPEFRVKVEEMLGILDGTGFKYRIIEGFRSTAVQKAYYAQGRNNVEVVNEWRRRANLGPITEKANKVITKCDGERVKSKHQSGLAVDIVPVVDGKLLWETSSEKAKELWTHLGQVGKMVGLEWGGDWDKTASTLGWDCPHFEMKEG